MMLKNEIVLRSDGDVSERDDARLVSIINRTVNSSQDELKATDDLAFVQSVGRAVEKARKEKVGPLNDQVREWNIKFREILLPISQAETHVKSGIRDWRRKERARVAEQQERIERENARREKEEAERLAEEKKQAALSVETQGLQIGMNEKDARALGALVAADVQPVAAIQEVAPEPPPTTVKSTLGKSTSRFVWKFEVMDESAVPRAYCKVDSKKITDAVRDGLRDIPGVRIFEDEIIAGSSS